MHGATDVDEVVGDDAEANPAVHSDVTLIAAAVEAVSPLDHADATLASGAPLLAVAEPALSLLAFAFEAFSRAIGNADTFDALGFRRRLVLYGVVLDANYALQTRAADQPTLGDAAAGHPLHARGNDL